MINQLSFFYYEIILLLLFSPFPCHLLSGFFGPSSQKAICYFILLASYVFFLEFKVVHHPSNLFIFVRFMALRYQFLYVLLPSLTLLFAPNLQKAKLMCLSNDQISLLRFLACPNAYKGLLWFLELDIGTFTLGLFTLFSFESTQAIASLFSLSVSFAQRLFLVLRAIK